MKIYAPLPADGTTVMKPVFFEAREDAEAYMADQGVTTAITEYDLVPMIYHQEARPFICFPLDNSVTGWIQVAKDLEDMIAYLIEQKVEKVQVKYVDRRLGSEVESPRDYGLSVVLMRDKWTNQGFYDELLKKTASKDGQG
jgi:hypothetical protein